VYLENLVSVMMDYVMSCGLDI